MASTGRLPHCPEFPSLRDENHRITSPATPEYNCIAWAARDAERFWWPDTAHTAYWPETVAREETLRAFTDAYRTLGYSLCENDALEAGFEKIAIFALETRPTHAARQLESGLWTSKLGRHVDIEHELRALEGPCYGNVALYLKRPRPKVST